MNEDAVPGNGCDDVRVEEITDQVPGRRVVDVCCRNTCGVVVRDEEFVLELFVVGTRVISRIGISHSESHRSRCRTLHAERRGYTVNSTLSTVLSYQTEYGSR